MKEAGASPVGAVGHPRLPSRMSPAQTVSPTVSRTPQIWPQPRSPHRT